MDDQHDILRMLHATLDTLGHKLEVYEAPSGEEALLEATRHRFDLLISDYKLPGMTGVELMNKVRAKNPDVKTILITAMNDRKSRDEMREAGAMATFDKPIPLADFLDMVERALALKRTILPPEDEKVEANRETIADLLTKLRKQVKAEAVYLLSDRGRILERAGDLYDSSMEVSLLSSLMAIYSAGLKVSRFIHQDTPDNFHVFRGGDHDLILIPVNSSHALLLAGKDLASAQRMMQTVEGMLFVRGDVENVLQSLGVAPVVQTAEPEIPVAPEPLGVEPQQSEPEMDVDALFANAGKKAKVKDVDAFWDEAVEKSKNIPTNPDVITFDEARKLGLDPGKASTIKPTRPLKGLTGLLKKK